MKFNQNCGENIYGCAFAQNPWEWKGQRKDVAHSIIFCRIQSKNLCVLTVICYFNGFSVVFYCDVALITLPQNCTYVLGGLGKALSIRGLEMS
jgi:hypothetical protein